jgi:hypothetical protein
MSEISVGLVKNLLKDNVNVGWTAIKFVPCPLSDKQKQDHVSGPAREAENRPRIHSEVNYR